jgi:FtsH-binding integral membrane protein
MTRHEWQQMNRDCQPVSSHTTNLAKRRNAGEGMLDMSHTGTVAGFAFFGAVIRIAIKGIYRNPMLAVISMIVSVGLSVTISPIILHYLELSNVPVNVQGGVYSIVAVIGTDIVERIDRARFAVKIGGVELESKENEK